MRAKQQHVCKEMNQYILYIQPAITNPIKVLINKSIDQSVFPEKIKAAQVSPLFKKHNSLDKSNYRPISVLPTISKFYERAIFDQLMEFLNNHFNPLLSAFRSGFGCQTALLRIIEDWKKALDDNKFIAAILMDLSKAFDCLPHNLLMLKLEAYGLSENSLKLLKSYLENRRQRIKIGNNYSEWDTLIRGAPQGSILGPVLFNVFINDIFHFVQDSTIYNYADDNTLSYSDTNKNTVVKTLENDSINLIDWFSKNLMKANPDKFQAIAIGPKTNRHNLSFDLKGNKITCEANVKLLNRLGRLTIYYSFILSNFNYCPVTWHFCSEKILKN